jgi:hypothetical protein
MTYIFFHRRVILATYQVKVSEDARSLDPSLFPIYSEKVIFGRHRAIQLAAGDPADSSPSDGRLGGGRSGNPWIPAG